MRSCRSTVAAPLFHVSYASEESNAEEVVFADVATSVDERRRMAKQEEELADAATKLQQRNETIRRWNFASAQRRGN